MSDEAQLPVAEKTLPTVEAGENLTIEAVLPVIEECRGNVSAIARHFSRTRRAMKDFIDRKPELLALLNDLREAVIDNAEDNIFASVAKGDMSDSRFVVATLGKDRGWVPRAEATGKGGADLLPPTIVIQQYPDEPEAPAVDGPANDGG